MFNMMTIITMMPIIWHTVAGLNCSAECQFKNENGEYLYITQVTTNETCKSFTWINATNHTVATNRDPSVPPVKASSYKRLVSDRNLGYLKLKRYYYNKLIDDKSIQCCVGPYNDNILDNTSVSPEVGPYNDNILDNTTSSMSPEGEQSKTWIAVGAVLAVGLAVCMPMLLKRIKKLHFWKKKNKEGYTPGSTLPALVQDTPV